MIEIIHDFRALQAPIRQIRNLAMRILKVEGITESTVVTLVLCSNYTIRKLNAQYRRKNKATDVLSFAFNEQDFLGEIYISLQKAKVQARRFGFTYNQEILRLLVHGVFHLLGYDHHTIKDQELMESKERIYTNL